MKAGRKSGRAVKAAWMTLMVASYAVAAILALVSAYDMASSRWIDVPLDVIFLAVFAAVGYGAMLRYERAAHSRPL